MNNGHMMESIADVAILEDVELETFVAFCEFAYKGSYTVPEAVVKDTESATEVVGNGHAHTEDSRNANVHTEDGPAPPPEPESARTEGVQVDAWVSFGKSKKKVWKKKKVFGGQDEWEILPPPMPDCKLEPWPYNPPPPEPKRETQSEKLWKSFQALEFVDSTTPSPDRPPALTFHAKVYVFATKYLIRPLRNLCLSYLHRELCQYPVDLEDRQDIFDLVEYTYTHTTRSEAWGPQLRELVAHYIACYADLLVHDKRMTRVLDNHGEAGSDLLRLLVE